MLTSLSARSRSVTSPTRRLVIGIIAASIGLLLFNITARAEPPPPDAVGNSFLQTWKRLADQPQSAATAWKEFAQVNPRHDLGQLARLLQAIAMLRERKPDVPAILILTKIDPGNAATPISGSEPSAFRKQLVIAGQGLAARAMMVQLAGKLQDYYRKRVEYPASLDDLIAAKLASAADVTDPFGKPFAYETRPRKLAPNIPRQEFTLSCTTTKARSDMLTADLKQAAAPVRGLALSSVEPRQNQAFIRQVRKDGTPGPARAWSVGETLDDFSLAGVFEGYIVVIDHGWPKVVAKESP